MSNMFDCISIHQVHPKQNIKSGFINENFFTCHPLCGGFLQMGIRLLRGVWVPWFWCSHFKTMTPDPHRRSPLTCHGQGSCCGSNSPLLGFIAMKSFFGGEGLLSWLSQRVQSFICDRQGPSAPQRPWFWTQRIKALTIAADECRHVGI